MIFENIKNISSKDEFLEKILIYIRLVEVTAERNGYMISNNIEINYDIIDELIAIGIISTNEEISELKALINPLYQRLINCINFYLNNKTVFGSTLDRLNNSKRKELQTAEHQAPKPTFADFFAGAGGLSPMIDFNMSKCCESHTIKSFRQPSTT